MLMGNVDLPEEIEPAVRFGEQGVGLLRTEFLLTGRTSLPTEDEQTEYFRRVALAFAHQTVILRRSTSAATSFRLPSRRRPKPTRSGWRSIRVCLDQPEVFRTQLRAVLRAAADRDVQLMLPLVTRVEEVLRTKELLTEEAEALKRAGFGPRPRCR